LLVVERRRNWQNGGSRQRRLLRSGRASIVAPVLRNVRTYELTCDTPTTCVTTPPSAVGSTKRITTTDPGRLLLTGNFADSGHFDPPALRGISKTAPYFHNNSAVTLEEVVIHYEEFYKRIKVLNPGVPLPILTTDGVNQDRPNEPSERAALVAYLLKL
jgi:cytochrome c peroxidase